MAKVGEQGWLGITWPEEYGGKDGEGIYEYLLNEALAARGGPQIGKGVGIIGKTIISHGSEQLKQEFLPQDPAQRGGVRRGLLRAQRRVGRRLHAAEGHQGGRGLAPQRSEDLDHLGPLRRLVLGGGPHRPRGPKHHGITLFLVPMDHPNITVKGIWTMGDERTNEVYLDDVFVPDDYVVGELNKGFQYISEALDLERFTLFTYSPIAQRLDLLTEYVKGATRDGEPLKDDAVVRSQIAQLHTEAEVARVLGLKFVFASSQGGAPPTSEASEYKLFTTEYSRRLANASMDIGGPGAQLRVRDEDAPMAGRSESTYRYTVIDTIGGGASEIQKNIIARRKLGLPKNF